MKCALVSIFTCLALCAMPSAFAVSSRCDFLAAAQPGDGTLTRPSVIATISTAERSAYPIFGGLITYVRPSGTKNFTPQGATRFAFLPVGSSGEWEWMHTDPEPEDGDYTVKGTVTFSCISGGFPTPKVATNCEAEVENQ